MLALSRRQILQRAAALGGAAAVGLLAVACGAQGPSPGQQPVAGAPSGAAKPSGPVTLEEWNFSSTRIAWQIKALKDYQQKVNPDVHIHWVTLPYGEMHEKLLMTVMAGTGAPDIADVEISAFSRFLKEPEPGFLPLNSRLQQIHALPNLYQPSATDPWSWKGQIYGLGNELNVCLWCYNWQIMKQYGIKTPIATWADFAQAGKEISGKSAGKTVIMDFMDLGWGDWWMRALEGGSGFFDANGQPVLNSEIGVQSLQYGEDAVHKDKWSITTPVGNAYNAALQDKNIASLLGPSWKFSGFLNQALPTTKGWWNVQLMPRWTPNGGGAATWGGTGVCAMRASPHADIAADFVVWEHTTPQAVLHDFKVRQVWPTLKTAWSAPQLKQPIPFFNNQNVGQFINEAAPLIPKWYNSPYWAEVTDAAVRLGITPAMHNRATAKNAMDSAQKDSLYLISVESANGKG